MNERANLYLVGLMGSGKTTIGRQLARRLDCPFHDSDHEVEARTGVNIPTIFEIEGEAGFRRREVQVIDELTRRQGVVLATGGGAVQNPINRQLLHSRGWVAYLNVAPERLWERLRYDKTRPLLRVPDPLGRLRALHAERDPWYRETAHFVVEGGALSPATILQMLLQEFQNHAHLEG